MNEFLLLLTVGLPLALAAVTAFYWFRVGPARRAGLAAPSPQQLPTDGSIERRESTDEMQPIIPSRWASVLGWLSACSPLPALALALVGESVELELPWLLVGARWGLDPTARVFLGFTAVLWLAAGIYARSYLAEDPDRLRFDLFHLLTLAGNLGSIISQDMASFLMFYTLMSLSAYGLITHDRKPASVRAGRVYIVLSIFGEVLLFWAVVLTSQHAGTRYLPGLAQALADVPTQHLSIALVLVGFGIKLGVMPLHFWLPLAHPAAPTPASAVLSGAMIKVGLLGLLRFLPFGSVQLESWGAVCLVAGIATAFLAVVIGVTQSNPKTVLAYSSVSQMGLMAIALGAALMSPVEWDRTLAAILFFAAQHAVCKAALFLGVGVAHGEMRSAWQRRLVMTGLVIAALALAGLPFTTGFAAKIALKYAAAIAPDQWAAVLAAILPITGLTTTLLVSRFLWLVWPTHHPAHGRLTWGMLGSWGALTLGVAVGAVVLRWPDVVEPAWLAFNFEAILTGTWPIVVAGILILPWIRPQSNLARRFTTVRFPTGDIVVPLTAALMWLGRIWNGILVARLIAFVEAFHRWWQRMAAISSRNLLDLAKRGLDADFSHHEPDNPADKR